MTCEPSSLLGPHLQAAVSFAVGCYTLASRKAATLVGGECKARRMMYRLHDVPPTWCHTVSNADNTSTIGTSLQIPKDTTVTIANAVRPPRLRATQNCGQNVLRSHGWKGKATAVQVRKQYKAASVTCKSSTRSHLSHMQRQYKAASVIIRSNTRPPQPAEACPKQYTPPQSYEKAV